MLTLCSSFILVIEPWHNVLPYLFGWSLLGDFIGCVFAIEKHNILLNKYSFFEAVVLGLLNLLISMIVLNTNCPLGYIVLSFTNSQVFALTELSLYNHPWIYLFYLSGMLIWSAIGAATGSIIQNMHEGVS